MKKLKEFKLVVLINPIRNSFRFKNLWKMEGPNIQEQDLSETNRHQVKHGK